MPLLLIGHTEGTTMALAIVTNNTALRAAASASSANRDMETYMARLSSGKRINSASDDAAGVAISSRLSAEIRGTDQAIRNSLDGQALIDTAEGAHKEIENILQRMREVAVQAANDTNNSQDRDNLQAEMNAMSTEIDRIAGTTTWAGANLMEAATSFSFQVGTATGNKNQIVVNIKSMNTTSLLLNGGSAGLAAVTDATYPTHRQITVTKTSTDLSAQAFTFVHPHDGAESGTVTFNIGGVDYERSFLAEDNLVVSAAQLAINSGPGPDGLPRGSEIHGYVASWVEVENAPELGGGYYTHVLTLTKENGTEVINAPKITHNEFSHAAVAAGISSISVEAGGGNTAADNARDSISLIDNAIKTVNVQRSELGAASNRLNHTINNLTNISSNLSAAKGGIEDADFAKETTDLAKNQILQQA